MFYEPMRVVPLFLLAAACTAVPSSGPPDQGPSPDAAPAVDGAPLGPVEVSVTDAGGNPAAGITVRFTDGSGALVTDVVTDATGYAEVLVPHGVTATAIWPLSHRLQTVVGVDWGDHLQLGAAPFVQGARMTLDVPAPPAGFTDVVALGPCALADDALVSDGHGGLTTSVSLVSGCAPYEIVVRATDAGGHVDYLATDHISPVDGGTIALADAWQPMPELHAQVALGTGSATVFQVERVAANTRFSMTRDLTHPEDFEGTIEAPPVASVDEMIWYWVDHDPVWVARAIPSDLRTQPMFDASPLLIPAIHGAALAGGTVRWTTSGTGAADAVSVSIASSASSWDLLVPPGATSVTLPTLPASARALVPGSDASVVVSADESDAMADYMAARNLPAGGVAQLETSRAWTRWVHAGPISW